MNKNEKIKIINILPKKRNYKMNPRFLFPFLFLLLLSSSFLQESSQFTIVKFVKPGKIRIGDHTLNDWNEIKPILSLTCENQWKDSICDEPPEPCRSEGVDLQVSFYLAWDGARLFFAVNVVDDKLLYVHSFNRHLYRGDSAELFFVTDCSSQKDYHECAQNDKSVFQLLLCPNMIGSNKYHFAEYRTPERIIKKALKYGFKASSWKNDDGWQAEAVFPLKALIKTKPINWNRKRVKITFDVLDYDHHLADWDEPCWGFNPDHVISNVEKMEMATNPHQMPEFVFEASK